uniref:UDP-N-acetylglucosamine/UDP-glucose/GDP-mannose transporter n=1 Tax=Phallusia mammillata TaxID=59560 RepID=A0A6F9DT99_9ASCI|nr:UDP-N-acetylglucosamine/UDP-glucose/GDP-mannose transporter [Phallusia mammillata]
MTDESLTSSPTKRVLAALFYAFSSVLIVMANKSVLTNYGFPSAQFLGVGQMVAAVIIMQILKVGGFVSFPDMSSTIPRKIFPLPLLYLGNLVFGLGGTKKLSLPMFTVLRRFSILMTMLLEIYIFKKAPSKLIVVSILTMTAGSVIAASNDLAFELVGYVLILANDVCTAANNVFTKKHLNANELGKYGILYYNCLFMIIPGMVLCASTGDVERVKNFEQWNDMSFLFQFFVSSVMGVVLMYSVTMCTAYNSALTTTVVGCLKNISVTYVGMVFGGDYIFSWPNFVGITISVLASLVYSAAVFTNKKPTSQKGNEASTKV